MPRKKTATARSRNGRLEDAIALLVANEASFLQHLARMDERFARMDERFARNDERFAEMDARLAERFARIDERFARIDERFARIENELAAIKAILLRHEQMLEALPQAIKKEIGFKPR